MFLRLLLKGVIGITIGAYFKVNGHEYAWIVLSAALLVQLISLIGLFFNNLSKIRILVN